MGIVDNRVDRYRDNFGDSSCGEKSADCEHFIHVRFPQGKVRDFLYLSGKQRNLHPYSYY